MITITLHGTNTATCGSVTVATAAKKGPIGPLCRKLIELGHSDTELVSVYRGDTPVFAPCPISAWANYDVSESDTSGIRRKKYVEFVAFA